MIGLAKRALAKLPWRRRTDDAPRSIRVESFGAIAQLETPRALAFVDREFARELGVTDHGAGSAWADASADGDVGAAILSAPLEAHLQLTNQCPAGCRGCYTGATPRGEPNEWGETEWKRAIDRLADMGVFHLALGGGESAILPWLGEVASYASSRGLVPNLTTSGIAGLDNLLAIADRFGQINVSLDGLGDTYRKVRGFDGFGDADRAIRSLREVKREIGINVVVTRHNFDELGELFAYARRRKLNEIELLRFKPSGRGATSYAASACTDAQHRALYPTIARAAKRHRVRVRVDCSYTPMIAHHGPSPDVMAKLAVYGCTAGDFLVAAKADGSALSCSFAPPPAGGPTIDELPDYWQEQNAFERYRTWREPAQPCRSCRYLELCRGGCKVVSRHVCGAEHHPDPECPRVVDHAARGNEKEPRPRAGISLPVVR